MNNSRQHSFHIPVMGLGFTIDTPLKVGRFGINSVISIIEDELIEEMRQFHCVSNHITYHEIKSEETDARARRITAYLNLVNELLCRQVENLKKESFEAGNEISKYFDMLPDIAAAKIQYLRMLDCRDVIEKEEMQNELRKEIRAGSIDVNIMAKADKINYDGQGNALPREYSDALSALRGYAKSNLHSSLVLSAGYNPLLYTYLEEFSDFFPDSEGFIRKKIILKVSDYRSAITQGKILAKKGIWVSEYRIESGLNCGGHAFATEGKLLGPILEEFKQNKSALKAELLGMCNNQLEAKALFQLPQNTTMQITVQGGIGTSFENNFLLEYYEADSTGWGSPFLLVPEATNVDSGTLNALASAAKEDYYLSQSSPLGISFHSFRKSTSELQRLDRINRNRPGSPCYKKFLSTNTEFTDKPICTASREYQNLKIKQLQSQSLDAEEYYSEFEKVVAKDCLCEGLGESVRLKNHIKSPHKLDAVAICPGPNLAYFSGIFSLHEMIDHIYGRINLLGRKSRSNMFLNELKLYIDYFGKELQNSRKNISKLQSRHLQNFKNNMLEGVEYYHKLSAQFHKEGRPYIEKFSEELNQMRDSIISLLLPETVA